MSNEQHTKKDQADELRNKVGKDHHEIEETDISALPSRSEVHQHKQKKTKWKLKYPMIKTLAFFFILLPIVIYSIFTYLEGQGENRAQTVNKDTGGFETVDINQDDKKTSLQVREEEPDKESAVEDSESEVVNDPEQNNEENKTNNNNDKNDQADPKETTKPVDKGGSVGTTDDSQANKEVPKQQEQPVNVVYHTVQPSETLFRISMKYYKSQVGIEMIKSANGLPNNDIHVGQVLKIPLNK